MKNWTAVSLLVLAALVAADEDHTKHPKPTLTFPAPPAKWTTSTVYSTSTQTIIDCPPAVPHCPVKSTAYTTVVIPVSTTICPVTTTEVPTVKPPHPSTLPPPPPPPKPTTTYQAPPAAPPPPVVVPSSTTKAPPPSAQVTTKATTSVGTVSKLPPTKTGPSAVVTAGANIQRAGGALAAVAIAAALI